MGNTLLALLFTIQAKKNGRQAPVYQLTVGITD